MGELKYAQTSGATRKFFYVQTFIGNRTNGEESFDSHPPFGLTWTGTASSQSPTPLFDNIHTINKLHLSHVICQMSGVMCHMSGVIYHLYLPSSKS